MASGPSFTGLAALRFLATFASYIVNIRSVYAVKTMAPADLLGENLSAQGCLH